MHSLQISQMTPTMSSLEIAQLTGKNHADVLRDIRVVLEEAEIGESKFAGSYFSSQNKELPCYNLPRRECDLVVSGYSVKYRLAIIDRWQELEQVVQVIADENSITKEELIKDKKLDLDFEAYLVEHEARVLKAKADIDIAKKKVAVECKLLDNKLTTYLSQGAKVKGDMHVGKQSLPVETITSLLKSHGSKHDSSSANHALLQYGRSVGYAVTERGSYYGRTVTSSATAKTKVARWFVAEFPELLAQIDSYLQ